MNRKVPMVEKAEDIHLLYEHADNIIANIFATADMYMRLYIKLKEAITIELNDRRVSEKIIKATYLSVMEDIICKEQYTDLKED